MLTLDKVTAFITCGSRLLLFRHLFAGIQIPAGTVEEGETPEQAVLRETFEETGLSAVRIVRQVGAQETTLAPNTGLILTGTKVFARPDPASFDWAFLRRGLTVQIERLEGDFAQVSYIEHDRITEPRYITYQITGWIPRACLAESARRTFFHLELLEAAPERWERFTDQHTFELFWAPLDDLPEIVEPQNGWVQFLKDDTGPTA
jgi:8-oxo-dGTP pyrophosphatase MutT (NUDIX family)